MPGIQIVDNFLNTIVDTVQVAFTAGTTPVPIDAFTAVNNSTVNASFKAYIKSSTGILVPLIPFQIVVWGEVDLGIGAVNQVIPAGGTLQVETSALNAIYFTVSGRNQ